MKKFIFTILFLMSFIMTFAQKQKYINTPVTFTEIGFGANIPTDGSDTFGGVSVELGRYINPIFGVGINFTYGENTYDDGLGLVGINTHYKLSPYFNPEAAFDFELFAGLNYGWLSYYDSYDDWYYYDRHTISYIVPKVGANIFVNLDTNNMFQIGLEPSFSWYISTDQDKSKSVGVFNILGKVRINF